ncbi:Nuclear pore complex protein nup98 [Nesidiocoris tenuis]|uniref:Nuclear pore complex protein Nup98-Nup96 n=1 Tax=Nesidiocoris tenuis TaxID=355587 RepID=A0ABN7ALQ6_9HEMI|nr:Nuclear pore complex protein nup98 [Nesidiocoris tenuis]
MFPSTGFGQPATSASSPFGRPTTSGFNPPVFGATATNNLFGGGTTQSSGLFGASTTTPAFGQTQPAQPAFGGFTTSAGSSTGLFGTQPNATASGGMFGSNTTQAFGQPKTSFGFGSSQPSSLFGQQAQQTSLFGQPATQSASGLFSSTPGFGATQPASGGTTIKFALVSGTETMVKNGSSTSISTRHHCITCMKEYENKSLEELRMEDYMAGRKGTQQGAQSAGMFGASIQPTLFGPSTSTSGGGLFGTENKSLFGTTNQGFGATTGNNMFGGANQTTSLFGKPAATASPFGAPTATTATNSFGFNNTSTNLFGSNTAQKPFGSTAPQAGNIFGAQPQTSTAFGTQPAGFGAGFGTQPAQNGGLFGAKPAFGLGNTSQGFSFNQPTSTSTTSSLFGAKPATTGFGGGFGTTTNTTSGFGATGFGQPNQNASPFGLNLGGGSSLFNNPTSKPGGLFGQTNTGGGLFSGNFGSTNTFNSGSNPLGGLGTQSGLGSSLGGGLSSLGGQSTQNPINQHLAAYSAIPFGDSPLFKNILPPTGKADELIKPTSPAAQKAIISGQNYKISPRSSNKIKMKPVESNPVDKKSLFDGLDGDFDFNDSPGLTPVSRLNPKRLIVRPKIVSELSDTQTIERTNNRLNETTVSRPIDVIFTPPGDPEKRKIIEPGRGLGAERQLTIRKSIQTSNVDVSMTDVRSGPSMDSPKNTSVSKNDTRDTAASLNSSSDSDVEDSGPPELDGTLTEHPAKIVLRRAGYYTIPSLNELASLVAPDGSCVVDNFTVGRLNYGNVFFPESFDVAGLNLDEIVHFRLKEVVIYPDDETKPPLGTGLNRRAQVTLDRVWPTDKSTRQPITDPARIAALDFESKLIRASGKAGTRFVEYRPQTGSWVFKVDHFSKYGLAESDDEDQAPVDVKKRKMAPQEAMAKQNPLSSTPLQPADQMTGGVSSRGAVLLREEDEEMIDRITTPFELDEELERGTLSPTSKLGKEMGLPTHKLQLMKASFFDQGEFKVDGENVDFEDLDQPPMFQFNGLGFDPARLAQAVSWYKRPDQMDTYSDVGVEFESRPDLVNDQPMSDREESISGDEIEPIYSGQIQPKTYILRHKGFGSPVPVLAKAFKSGCLVDLGIFNGASCRVGWGPKCKMMVRRNHDAAISSVAVPSLLAVSKETPSTDDSPSFLQYHKLYVENASSPVSFQETVLQHLEIVYRQSEWSEDGGCPFVRPKLGVTGLHRHQLLAMHLDNAFSDSYLKNAHSIWTLCAALWDSIGDCSDDGHFCVMQRKSAVSDWLESCLSEEVTKEAADQDGTAGVYSYLTGHKIFEACEKAQSLRDFQLSLLINQTMSVDRVRSTIHKQLIQWQQTRGDTHVDRNRMKCLMLAAGLSVHHTSDGVLNACQDLSWLRAFALHLWYFTPMSSSVTDALDEYEKSFNGPEDENYSCQPLPLYMNQFPVESSTNKPVYDVRFHLLKLFSSKSHPLEPLLNPASFTPDALDYRLCWFLMRALMELGYSHVNLYSSCVVHMSFASQLEAHGLWHWAVFIVLHLPDEEKREKYVKDLLDRHVSLDDENEEEYFLLSRLRISPKWIYEAKATKASYYKRYDDAARYLLKAEKWNECHRVIMKNISSTAIIEMNYDYLEGLLKELTVGDRHKSVANWSTGGDVILEYLGVVRQVNDIVAARDPSIGYHLERLQPQLKDLCMRIMLMSAVTALDRLARSEMAKRTVDLIQNLVIAHFQDDSPRSLNALSHLMEEVPLPSDHSLVEWLELLASFKTSLYVDRPE